MLVVLSVSVLISNLCSIKQESYFNFQGIIRKDSPNGHTTDNVTTFFFNNCMVYVLD